jgi:hypothetical protein
MHIKFFSFHFRVMYETNMQLFGAAVISSWTLFRGFVRTPKILQNIVGKLLCSSSFSIECELCCIMGSCQPYGGNFSISFLILDCNVFFFCKMVVNTIHNFT